MNKRHAQMRFIFIQLLMVVVGGISCFAAESQASPKQSPSAIKIGVMGAEAEKFLKQQGFNCKILTEDAWKDAAVLKNYPVIVCDTFSYETNRAYYQTVSAYAKAGGVVWLTYCYSIDLAATYVNEPSAWGPCLQYEIESQKIAVDSLWVAKSVPLADAWTDVKFTSYGLREPNKSHASVLVRGDFCNRGSKQLKARQN